MKLCIKFLVFNLCIISCHAMDKQEKESTQYSKAQHALWEKINKLANDQRKFGLPQFADYLRKPIK